MSRITPSRLRDRAADACRLIGLSDGDLWVQRSETGWHVFRRFGAGAQPLAECLTASEADHFLNALSIGAVLRNR